MHHKLSDTDFEDPRLYHYFIIWFKL